MVFTLLSAALPLSAENGVIVLLKNGRSVGFAFEKKPQLVTAKELNIYTNEDKRVSFEYKDLQRVFFDDVSVTKIESVSQTNTANHVIFRLMDNGIEALGLAKGETVNVYNISGIKVGAAKSSMDNGSATIVFPVNEHSVYIVRTNTGVSYKFMKR